VHYQTVGRQEDHAALAARVAQIEADHDLGGNRVFYLALPPSAFAPTMRHLGDAGLARSEGWIRLVVEKPFGRDLASARELNEVVHASFSEDQVYRIDHYLGKETVQNLLAFRFANSIFEALWNRDRIAQVEITVAEEVGLEGRAGYYEQAGAIRDMLQNHITQVLTLVAMEAPATYDAVAIRNEKVKVLQSMSPPGPDDVALGRYTAGVVDGREVPGYLDEDDIEPGSRTPTYAAVRLFIDNWRWQGVPFLVRTGKRLPRRVTQIAVRFRRPPVSFFASADEIETDLLKVTLQPEEGFELRIDVKRPGERMSLESIPLDFQYAARFGEIPDAYETLLRAVIAGDQTLFVRSDEVEESWRLYDPILDLPVKPHPYAAGTWGPQAATALVANGSWTTR
jgi:glucose-6-phosphate 1-dehydrogenase